MKRAIWWCGCGMLVLLVLFGMIPSERKVRGGDSGGKTASGPAGDWWSLSDADFLSQYGKLATGTQKEQSQFAWMAFGRVNQQVASPDGKQKFSQWEMWPDDPRTFTPDQPLFETAKKIRTRPHLQPIQQLRMFAPHPPSLEKSEFPTVGQEVTRNLLSYNYITGKHLNTARGIADYLGGMGNRIDLPVGAVETKAIWEQGAKPGAYQVGGLSLTALHLMVKVRSTPADPFTDNSPSWFWTTFELKTNPGLAAAQKLITYGDALPANDSQDLLQKAGLGDMAFTNYVCNGPQIQFFDDKNPSIVLGNTKLEFAFATPPSRDPTKWTKWTSSCHACHAEASGQITGSLISPNNFTPTVGPLKGDAMPGPGSRSYDFIWALAQAQ